MEAMWPQYSTAVAGRRGRRSFWGGAAMTDQAHVVASTGADRGGEAPPRPAIQVVPVKGLPIVAAIVVFLIVAITKNWRWALDWYHVAGGGLDRDRPLRGPYPGADPGSALDPGARRVHCAVHAEDGADHAHGRGHDPRGRLSARRQPG